MALDGTRMIKPWSEKDFIAILEKLVSTPGPSLNEEPRRRVLKRYFETHGVPTETDSAGNLLVTLGHGPWDDSVIFDAHMDVVQEGYEDRIVYKDGTAIGLGVADNLTAVTLLAMAAVSLHPKTDRFLRPVVFLFSTGEEGHGNLKGVRQVVMDHPSPPFVFVSFDLSFEEYSVQGLGSARYRLNVTGPGGHSWENYGLPSAIDMILDFFSSLKQSLREMSEKYPGALSFNIGRIAGGEGINSIARSAEATFEFRSIVPEALTVLDSVVSDLCGTMNGRSGITMACDITGLRPAAGPVMPERVEPLVSSIYSEIGEYTRSVIRSTNINATLAAGWPSICMGLCRSGRFHTHEEYVVLDSLPKGWTVLEKLVENLILRP